MPLTPDEIQDRASRIKLVIFDVDGVLTDGSLTYGPSGEALKTFNVRDGHGIVLLRLAGLEAGILSARDSEIVRTRMRDLGVRYMLQGQRDKARGIEILTSRSGVQPAEMAFIGDDVNDVPALKLVGLAVCPADAAPEALSRAHFITRANGGAGAARELCELVLKSQGKWTH